MDTVGILSILLWLLWISASTLSAATFSSDEITGIIPINNTTLELLPTVLAEFSPISKPMKNSTFGIGMFPQNQYWENLNGVIWMTGSSSAEESIVGSLQEPVFFGLGIVMLTLATLLAIFTSPMLRRFGNLKFVRELCRFGKGYEKILVNQCRSAIQKFRNPESRSTDDVLSFSISRVSPQRSTPETFYSTFHEIPGRRKISEEKWNEITKNSTNAALESLFTSPAFGQWAVAQADRLTLAPKKVEEVRIQVPMVDAVPHWDEQSSVASTNQRSRRRVQEPTKLKDFIRI
ncbi:OLC1v1016400C1 [Oldenlandia corymbosa var. corymbosa]|uniref:OLC1v1016400C1 n=1 Tax=Oldenlandia corymbosa var. corymbosa TaxID=529605 RepID=A0AAV1E5D7_OLDCO|nr:OLC1v1016400C1 [Oldenlandia corymbosa var. corymbosa]